jgi:hypothetical protein
MKNHKNTRINISKLEKSESILLQSFKEVINMLALRLKRYFLGEKEREAYENIILKEIPGINESVFNLDDKELEKLLEKLNVNPQEHGIGVY